VSERERIATPVVMAPLFQMEIGAAHAAGMHANQGIPLAGLGRLIS
jgi:hypothetical protein